MPPSRHTIIALYDATPEAEHFANPELASLARELGTLLAKSGIGMVTRVSSPLVAAALGGHEGRGAVSLQLSPAGSRHEHEHAYRLPHGAHVTLYTGRGAIGADKSALASSHGMAVIGSHEGMLASILEYAREHHMPVAILTSEPKEAVHGRVHAANPTLAQDLVVSADPVALVADLAMRLRRASFQ
jgi:hypothetical protein